MPYQDDDYVDMETQPKKKVSGRTDALMEQFRQMTEELYSGKVEAVSERLVDDTPYTRKQIDLLSEPDLLDRLVAFGKELVMDVDDVWRALFLAQASCYAPPIRQGKKVGRAQNHILLIGDPSTGKSQLYRNAMRMFPKCAAPTDFTPSAFVGNFSKNKEKQIGIAEQMDKAIMVVDEFDKLLQRYPHLDGYMRVIMEEQSFYRKTSYGVIEYETHPVVFAGANPKGDTFRDELMSNQIPFKYGLITRFDYLRPMCYSCSDVNKISRNIAEQAFQDDVPIEGSMVHRDVFQLFFALQESLMSRRVTQVRADKELVNQIQDTFQGLQKAIDGVPLLSVRDFMGALRFFNSSATLHVCQRKVENGAIFAQQEDVDNAIYLLENSVKSREVMLTTEHRSEMSLSPLERSRAVLLTYLRANKGNVEKQDAVDYLKTTMGISKTTAYEYIKTMVSERDGDISQVGLRDATLMLKD
jgi:DNA replicative helicase MCM subunit Mcm2 (Cdc46/Mcm family)